MIIQPDFLTHWKVQALSGSIGRLEAITALLALWGHCQNSRAYVFKFTLPMLAGICRYQGDATTLKQALLDCQLLDELPAGEFEVHGWAEKNASLLTSWENGSKGGRPAKNPRVNPNSNSGNPHDNPDIESRNPRVTHGVTERRKDGLDRFDKLEGEEGEREPDGSFHPIKISWSVEQGWTGFTPEIRAILEKAFPSRDLDLACNESDAWLRRNPANANKKNWLKFLTNWLRASSPSGEGSDQENSKKYGQKNEVWLGPPIHLVRPAPAGPWRAAFTATYSRSADIEWAALSDGIQSEIKTILAAADPLQLAVWADLEKNEGSTAA
jgi:hypothetical protein